MLGEPSNTRRWRPTVASWNFRVNGRESEEMMVVSIRRLVSGLVSSLCALSAGALFCSAPALANEVHIYSSTFGSEGSGPGQFKEPLGVAVNDVTHEVYVVDSANNRVERFAFEATTKTYVYAGEFNGSGAPTGAFLEPTQIAIDNSDDAGLDPSNEDVYVVDSGHGVIDKFSPEGVYLGQLTGAGTPGGLFETGETGITGVAVDPNGTLWVSKFSGPIYSFSDELANKYVSERETAFGGAREGLAVDAEDNLYVNEEGEFAKVNSSGGTLLAPFGGDEKAYGGAAVDPVGGEVYLDNLETIEAFSLSGEPIEAFGSGHLTFSKGLAIDTGNGTVYATDRSSNDVVVFDRVKLPTVKIEPASEQGPRSLTLNGTVNPEGEPVTSCVFEYATAAEYEAGKTYGHSVPCSPEAKNLGSGTNAEAVSAHLAGLTPGSVYHYRLVAENGAHKPNATADQEVFMGPRLGGQSVTDVASSSATVQDPIDPNGGDTHYYVQYGTSTAYGAYAPVAAPGVDLGSAVGAQSVSLHLQGLQAGTVYHYRFVVEQGGEAFAEPDSSFTTQIVGATAALPDGRSWELVSPADNKGALIELFEKGQVQAASDGSGVTYLAKGISVSDTPAGKITYAQVLSRRGTDGWGSVDLTLPGRFPETGEPGAELSTSHIEYHQFSSDLSLAAVEPQDDGTPPLSPGVTERTLYLRDDVSESFTPLVTSANALSPIEEPSLGGHGIASSEFEMHFLVATPDLGHVVLKTPKALTPEAIDEETVQKNDGADNVQWNLYEWGKGKLQLVNILPDGEAAHGPIGVTPGVRLAGTNDGLGLPRGGVQRVISSDGRRIAWTWGEPYGPRLQTYRGLYVRDMVEETTVRVGGASAIYQTMNSEGSKIFYRENGDLYVYDFETGTASALTTNHGSAEPSGGVQEVVSDVSEDGSYVYFVATGVLASGGVSGEDNLYVLHDTGGGWTTTYVASLSPLDKPSWYGQSTLGESPFLADVSSRVSPDGRYLAFMSEQSLTGYDNTDAVSGQPDEEVYLYDAQTGRLVCASCDPTGARPVGVFDKEKSELLVDRLETWTEKETNSVNVRTSHWLAGSIPGWDNPENGYPTYQPRYLSNTGRLFFDSPDALVPRDTNGLEDVYEFEPEGVGGCTSSTSSAMDVYEGELAGHPVDGCVGLISSGTSSSESAFYDASESGDDVFFTTTSRLTGEDYDSGYDVYDAHVCTGAVPCRTVPVPPPPCDSGDSCKAAPSPQPEIFGPPPSATFNGAGNVPPVAAKPAAKKKTVKKTVKCKKGRQRRRGKCVKGSKSKRTKARKANNHRRAAR